MDLLTDRNYLTYWITNFLFFAAYQMQFIARLWLMQHVLQTSKIVLGLTTTLQGAATLSFLPIAGILADRMARRHLLMGGRLGALAITAFLGLLVVSDTVQVWHVLAVSIVVGGLFAINQPVTQTYVLDIVGRDRLFTAITVNSMATSVGQMAGPAAGGMIIAGAGVAGALFISSGGFTLGVLALVTIPVLGLPLIADRAERSSLTRDLSEAVGIVRRHPALRWIFLLAILTMFHGGIFTMRPVFADEILNVGSKGFGFMSLAFGIGSMTSAVVFASLHVRRTGFLIPSGQLVWASSMVGYSLSQWFPLTLVFEAIMGLVPPIWTASTMTSIQMSVPEETRGRVLSLFFMIVALGQISGLLAGSLADWLGAREATFLLGVVPMPFLLAGILFARSLRKI